MKLKNLATPEFRPKPSTIIEYRPVDRAAKSEFCSTGRKAISEFRPIRYVMRIQGIGTNRFRVLPLVLKYERITVNYTLYILVYY